MAFFDGYALLGSLWPLKGGNRIVTAARRIHRKLGMGDLIERPMKLGHRMILDMRSNMEWTSIFIGKYDDSLVTLLTSLIKPGTAFLDVGANIGFYAVPIARVCEPTARCLAFEPLSTNAMRLKQNLSLNGLQDRVEVYTYGLSDHDGQAELILANDAANDAETGNAFIVTDGLHDPSFRRETIQLRRLDDMDILNETSVSVIKVDIEGHEDLFFSGARKMLARDRPIMATEFCRAYYAERGVDPDEELIANIPQEYSIVLINRDDSFSVVHSFSKFPKLANFLFCPTEKLIEIGLADSGLSIRRGAQM